MAMAWTRGEPQSPPTTWASELQAYERKKRHEVDPGLFKGPTVPLDNGKIQHAERAYNTLLQRFLDDEKDAKHRAFEQQTRLAHLNRSKDIQLRREQTFNIINNTSKIDAIQSENDFRPPAGAPDHTLPYPTTHQDHNIISNLPMDIHHWSSPETRPLPKQKAPRQRLVPAVNVKDFNIISNRYVSDHDDKTARDQTLNFLEATHKYNKRNVYDPVLQRCNDPRLDDHIRACHEACDAEGFARAQAALPISYNGSESMGYDPIAHQVKDEALLNVLDTMEQGRTTRYRTRYLHEQNTREQDILLEDAMLLQKNQQISHERHEETTRRGHDIINNRQYGNGPKCQKVRLPHTVPNVTPWEKTLINYDDTAPCNSARTHGHDGSSSSRSQPPAGVGANAMPDTSRMSHTHNARGRTSTQSSYSARGPASNQSFSYGATIHPSQLAAQLSSPPAPVVPGSPRSGSVHSRPRG